MTCENYTTTETTPNLWNTQYPMQHVKSMADTTHKMRQTGKSAPNTHTHATENTFHITHVTSKHPHTLSNTTTHKSQSHTRTTFHRVHAAHTMRHTKQAHPNTSQKDAQPTTHKATHKWGTLKTTTTHGPHISHHRHNTPHGEKYTQHTLKE